MWIARCHDSTLFLDELFRALVNELRRIRDVRRQRNNRRTPRSVLLARVFMKIINRSLMTEAQNRRIIHNKAYAC